MIIASQEIEPHGYKLPKDSMVELHIAYVSGDNSGTIKSRVILPEDVVVVGFVVRCEAAE